MDKTKLIKRLYNAQKSSSKKRGHCMPDYTCDDLINWVLIENKDLFELLYKNWADGNYESNLKPSIDRIQNSIHYTFSNIQLVTWGENDKKAHLDSIKGNITTGKQKECVYKIDQFGVTICLYPSISIASRDTNIDTSSIIRCCNGKVKTAGNFVWRYENENK